MCYANESWSRMLPFILLGLRSVISEEFQTSPAMMLYGENLRLPSDFIQTSHTLQPQNEFVDQLQRFLRKIQPLPASSHARQRIFIFKELDTCAFVLVRRDALRLSLQPPYEGPFKVINRNPKFFTLLINDKEVNVSVDRLKPYFSEVSSNFSETDSSFTPNSSTHQQRHGSPMPVSGESLCSSPEFSGFTPQPASEHPETPSRAFTTTTHFSQTDSPFSPLRESTEFEFQPASERIQNSSRSHILSELPGSRSMPVSGQPESLQGNSQLRTPTEDTTTRTTVQFLLDGNTFIPSRTTRVGRTTKPPVRFSRTS